MENRSAVLIETDLKTGKQRILREYSTWEWAERGLAAMKKLGDETKGHVLVVWYWDTEEERLMLEGTLAKGWPKQKGAPHVPRVRPEGIDWKGYVAREEGTTR